jgi:predicted nuclease of predicted toxin-antitoxin system
VKLLIDMNLSPHWVSFLGAAGFEAIHWSSVGAANATDIEIMAYASAQDYVVLSHDLDFSAILAATNGAKPSVVQLRTENLRPDIIGGSLIAALKQMSGELTAGALLTLDPGRARLKLLPLVR